jgi:hypothetical protein
MRRANLLTGKEEYGLMQNEMKKDERRINVECGLVIDNGISAKFLSEQDGIVGCQD